MPIRRIISVIVLAAAFVAGCTGSGATTAPASQPAASQAPASQAPGSAAAGPVTVGSANSGTLGSYLVGPNGLALYTHTGDTATSSTCTGQCAVAWPPLTVGAGMQATAGAGVTGPLATLTRADGTVQVTYMGLPLYYWKGDVQAGDTTGEGVNGFLLATVSGPQPVPSSTGKPGY